MKRILVATDFSTRSDRALLRGCLLARQSSATLILVHVVDDDEPNRLVDARQYEAAGLLHELSRTAREDGIDCESRVVLGDPFQGIVNAAEELGVDLLLLGPHRRQLLRDTFVGTTAERTIKLSPRPVLMANGVPASLYRSILIAIDLSDNSTIAAQTAKQLGLLKQPQTTALHVIEDERGPVARASMSIDKLKDRLVQEERRASEELDAILCKVGTAASRHVIRLTEKSVSMAINDYARRVGADLLVVGTHRRSGIEKWLLGSVAENIMAHSTIDVLAVPPDAIDAISSDSF